MNVERGRVYWVELVGMQLRVRAVEDSRTIPGWWMCIGEMGTEIMVPEAAFQQESGERWDGSKFVPVDPASI